MAAARTFHREVCLGDGSRRVVLALAHVASDPAYRGLGLGARVVRTAFDRLNYAPIASADKLHKLPTSFLFQTGVEGFYARLGARTLPPHMYPVHNSTGQGSDAKRRKGFWWVMQGWVHLFYSPAPTFFHSSLLYVRSHDFFGAFWALKLSLLTLFISLQNPPLPTCFQGPNGDGVPFRLRHASRPH